jgi:hypothetical protein
MSEKKENLANAIGIQPEEAEELFSEETLETMSTDSNVVEDNADDIQTTYCPVYQTQCVSDCGGSTTTSRSTTTPSSAETNANCYGCGGILPPGGGYSNGNCHQCSATCPSPSTTTAS